MGVMKRLLDAGSSKSGVKAKLDLILNKPLLVNAINAKTKRVLYKTGAYALTTMRWSIRPPKSGGKKARTVEVDGERCFVPKFGKVINADTGRFVSKDKADEARRLVSRRLSKREAGQPPRRGPSDLLRQKMRFEVDLATQTVIAGPELLSSQPKLVGVSNVPELLEFGGKEYIGSDLVQFNPHPFIEPAQRKAEQRMAELIEKDELRP